jgi:hypothetical protein
MQSITFPSAIILAIICCAVCLSPALAAGTAAQNGFVTIYSVPSGAAVSIDGKESGITPLSNYLVPYGIHEVMISSAGYNPYSVQINVTPDSTNFLLTPVLTTNTSSYLAVTTFPSGAEIFIDGKLFGTTPDIGSPFMNYGDNFLLVTDVPYGTHTVKGTLAGYPDLTSNITLVPPSGGMVFFNFGEAGLSQSYGSMGLASSPEGAQVYLDDVYKGTTPLYLVNNITPGVHEVRLVHDGYQEFSKNITVTGGKISSVTAFLSNTTSTTSSPTSGKAALSCTSVLVALFVSFAFFAVRKRRKGL